MVTRAKRGWIGVDVGTHALKVAQVERAAGTLRLVDAVAVPRTTVESDGEQPSRTVSRCHAELQAALALGKQFRGSTAACAMSMQWSHVKPLKVPADVDDTWSYIADELNAAGALEGHEFGYWQTGGETRNAENPTDDVIAITVSQQDALQLAQDVARCGLECRQLDVIPLALARAAQMIPETRERQSVAILDWGVAEATFCSLRNGIPVFVRRLRNSGFGAVLHQIGGELGLYPDEVETLLLSGRDTASEDDRRIARELHAAVAELASESLRTVSEEVRRTLAFLEHQMPSAIPEKTWLCGAGAVWNGAADYFAAKMRGPVATWSLRDAGIEKADEFPFPDEILATAISLSMLAWSRA